MKSVLNPAMSLAPISKYTLDTLIASRPVNPLLHDMASSQLTQLLQTPTVTDVLVPLLK